jgi:hypothetical protein
MLFVSCFAAVTLTASAVNAAPRGHGGHGRHGGYHGKHFSSISPRGGHKFSRSSPKFSRGTSGTYRNWGGGKWSGGNWGGSNWDWYRSSNRGIPYALNYGYYSYGYYPWYGYRLSYPFYWGWYPYWGWGSPYAYLSYSYYPYWYYPSYWYAYDDCSVSRRRFF